MGEIADILGKHAMRTVLGILLIGASVVWGQSQPSVAREPAKPVQVDRATAYYRYTLARMYMELSASSRTRSTEYKNKAIENYKAAIKADPESTLLPQELSRIAPKPPVRRTRRAVVPPPASQ